MSESGPGQEQGADADNVFARFLEQHSLDNEGAFEKLIREHSEIATDLQRLRRMQLAFADLFGRLAGPDSDGNRLLERLRERKDPATRYVVKNEVARGGMGAILRVWDEDVRRHLAMKVIRGPARSREDSTTSAVDSRSLGRFLDEAQITGQLDHPGIVPVHEIGIDANGRAYFTMKLVKGDDLRTIYDKVRMGSDGWSVTRALSVLLRVCEAMAFAHERGVIHRDLKPSNIMVGRHGEVYVMDWGLARVLDTPDRRDIRIAPAPATQIITDRTAEDGADSPIITMDGDVVGTPAYMPPEQAAGNLDLVGPKSDIYAAGAMLYQLLTGRVPYDRPGVRLSNRTLLVQVVDGPPASIHTLAPYAPPELISICEKAMERSVRDRYGSMLELASDLRAFLENRVVKAHEAGAVAELKKWVRRNRALAASLVLLVVLLLGAVVALAVAYRAKEKVRDYEILETDVELNEAERAARELFQKWPEQVPQLEDWVANYGKPIADKLPQLHRNIEKVRAEIRGDPNRLKILSAAFRQIVDRLRSFGDSGGALSVITERLAWARSRSQRTIDDHRAEWDTAIAEILADGSRYDDLHLEPQSGLIPLGKDPSTRLQEFLDLRSHAAELPLPRRDPKTGRFKVEEGTGLIFVLLPGGTATIGSQATDAGKPYYDPQPLPNSFALDEVELDPFFISKYEMTQGQWERLSFDHSNPSQHHPGIETKDGKRIDLTHPVESVAWTECRDLLGAYGLSLPSEVQWEYAARAGTTTPWWCGSSAADLKDKVNVADQSASKAGYMWLKGFEKFDDGFAVHCPVDLLAPNPFGLYHIHGNVWEYCSDWYFDDLPLEVQRWVQRAKGTGERVVMMKGESVGDPQRRVGRGGGFDVPLEMGRCAYRQPAPLLFKYDSLGARPVRKIDRSQDK